MSSDFEVFLVERFLDFYNRESNTKFEIINKIDETIRNRPSYDYQCSDAQSGGKMAIEVKRLVPKNRGLEANFKKEESILLLEEAFILSQESVKMMEENAVEDGALRMPGTVNSWHHR